jgi:energy-coupling factor transport system ATP-binding protein
MNENRIVLDGSVQQVFAEADLLRRIGLDVPPVTAVLQGLRSRGASVPAELLTVPEAATAIGEWLRSRKHA